MGNHSLKKLPIYRWCLNCALLMPGLALGQQPTTSVAQASTSGAVFRSRLNAAAQFYEELDYEQALKAIHQAKALASSADERAEAAVYEGIVLADMGKRPMSIKAFHEALSLRPASRLPVKVSPKVERDFEDVRAEVQSETLAMLAPEPSPSHGGDRPLRPTGESTSVSPLSTDSLAPNDTAHFDDESMRNDSPGRRIRPLPVALLGTGVLAGGLGTFFGLRSQGNIQNARDAAQFDDQLHHLDSARGQALGANILFGIATAAAAGAVVTYFLGDNSTHERGTP